MTPTELNAAIDQKYGHLFDLAERIKNQLKSDAICVDINDLLWWHISDEKEPFWESIWNLECDNNLTIETVRAVYLKHGIPLPEEKDEVVKPDKFLQGYMCALANLISCHGISTEAYDVYTGMSFTEEQMRKGGVDEFDIEKIKPIIEEYNRKRTSTTL